MKPAIKGGLVLCLSVIASALFLSTALGQRRPGTAVGGVTGRPPGFSGGVTGTMAGRPPGYTGGVTGVTGGISGMRPGTAIGGATGGVSGMRPGGAIGGPVGGVTGMGGVGGITGMNRTEWVYTCTVCGKEVMRSPVRLSNVKNCCLSPVGGRGVIGVQPPPGVQNPGPAILPPTDTGVKPPVVQPAPFVPPAPAFTDSSDPSTSTSGGSSGFSGAFLMIGIGTAVFGLIILAGVIVLVVQSQKGGAGAPRRRRYRDDY